MATRDKYNFTQIAGVDWGTISYNNIPSYSDTSIGTTGDAALVRQFLKKFFPFLETSVVKSGNSVRIQILDFTVDFTWDDYDGRKKFTLNADSLNSILEPLFEGIGFDGMTDSTYSKPLPKMINDKGFEVSYGYNYIFVNNDNIQGTYEVDLDKRGIVRGGFQVLFYPTTKSLKTDKGSSALNVLLTSQLVTYIVTGKMDSRFITTDGKSSDSQSSPSVFSTETDEEPNEILFTQINADQQDSSTPMVNVDETDLLPEKFVQDFVIKNTNILSDMRKNAPELYEAMVQGVSLVNRMAKVNKGILEPFKPLENQQELEDQLVETDFDLTDVDLQEIDLTGLEEDFEINEDDLGNLNLDEFDELADFVENELIPKQEEKKKPIDIDNLDALQQNILKVMSFDIAMRTTEIYPKLDDKVQKKYSMIDVKSDIVNILISPLDLVKYGRDSHEFVLNDTPETRRVVEEIKKQVPKLTPSSQKILEVLYKMNPLKSSVEDIEEILQDDYATPLTPKTIFKRLLELEQLGYANQTTTQYGGIKWSIDDDGYDYYQSRGISQTLVEKISNSLPYQDYLVLNVFNERNTFQTVEEITDYLQKQFNKTPNWDENEVGLSLENLTQLNLLRSDDRGTDIYFTILPMGIQVVQNLIEKEKQGIYPKQKTSALSGTRPSPSISATTQPLGTIMKGNDGNNWQIKENKNGTRRWVKMK